MEKQRGSGTTILIVVLAIVALGALAWAVYNQSLVDNLKRSLQETQDQLAQVTSEAEEARQEVAQEMMEGAQSIGQAIQGVDDPQLRLSLFRAYAGQLKSLLTPESQAELDKVVVYVERQPVVLVQTSSEWPAEIQAAVSTIKTEMNRARARAVASAVIGEAMAPTPVVGNTVTLTGTLTYVQSDPVTGAGIFRLTNESDGQDYYFQFNTDNTSTYQETLEGKAVSVMVETTGTENGLVTFDVVSGPTLVSVSPTPTAREETP